MLTNPVVAFSETTTLTFFVRFDTVATERIVTRPADGVPGVTVTVAVVELAADTVYPPLENAAFRSSCKRPSSAPAVAAASALNDAATPYPASTEDNAKNAIKIPAIITIPPIKNVNAKNA
jgi:hypothetical protein